MKYIVNYQGQDLSLQHELKAIANAIEELDEIQGKSITNEPDNPVEGMIRVADGTGWNPGEGAGAYIYIDGRWQKLSSHEDDEALAYFLDIV